MTSVAPPPVERGSPEPARHGLGRATARAERLYLPRQPLLRHLILFVLGAAFFYLVTVNVSAYNDYQIGEIALYAIVLAGLSLLTGLNGQFSLGHGAFMIIGAYTVALLQLHQPMSLPVELLVATLVAAAAGVVVGVPAARLSAPYLAGVTLMLALAVPQLSSQYGSVFGGEQGLTTTPPIAPGSISAERWLAWIEILCALIAVLLLGNLVRSRFGRAFRSVRDDEVAAELSGIHVARTKVLAFAVSAACAGLGGALLALSTGVVNTGEFPLSLSISLLAAMVLGGAGSLIGIWWGAIALVYMPSWSTSLSNHLSLGTSAAAYLSDAIFGAVLVAAMLAAPTGIQGGLRWAGRRLWRLIAGGRPPAVAVDEPGTGSDAGTPVLTGPGGVTTATGPLDGDDGPRVRAGTGPHGSAEITSEGTERSTT
ncbi:MAG: branched-chain amino acid ABC transporter permease [Acidimicrobiales bacterium]